MDISNEQFEEVIQRAVDDLPEKFKEKINNVAIIIEDLPTKEIIKKSKLGNNAILFGWYEGYYQSRKINVGPVLPDRIILFKNNICKYSSDEKGLKETIINTVKHEIAHHFGSNEIGAQKAAKNAFID